MRYTVEQITKAAARERAKSNKAARTVVRCMADARAWKLEGKTDLVRAAVDTARANARTARYRDAIARDFERAARLAGEYETLAAGIKAERASYAGRSITGTEAGAIRSAEFMLSAIGSNMNAALAAAGSR